MRLPTSALSGPRSASGVCPQSEQKQKSNLSDHSVRSLAIWDAESVFRLADASELASQDAPQSSVTRGIRVSLIMFFSLGGRHGIRWILYRRVVVER